MAESSMMKYMIIQIMSTRKLILNPVTEESISTGEIITTGDIPGTAMKDAMIVQTLIATTNLNVATTQTQPTPFK